MMREKIILTVAITACVLISSCFPKDMKEKMAKAVQESQVMFADQQFKTTLNNIEVFKLRNGYYPDSLREITFTPAFDTAYFNFVEYKRWADKYELNMKVIPKDFDPYPAEFWLGLGCERSNLMDLTVSTEIRKLDSLISQDSSIDF